MKIAIEGCAHGELEKIYETINEIEKRDGIKVDLLICCGDFQSTRNLEDLDCMAVPKKHQHICTFYKYYSGEKVAPILTLFIGGNHEASNYLQELPYGGWVAPNIYYLGYAGVVVFNGLRIAGISGIYKGHDYFKGRFESSPYSENSKRSVYHQRQLDVFRLSQLTPQIDVFLSHDWPKGITKFGNEQQLLKFKPFFREDIENDALGSPPCQELLYKLKPKYYFAAHLHCKFSAIVQHEDTNTETKFLALDKCLPRRRFLQILDVEASETTKQNKLFYDLEWLTILSLTNSLLSVKPVSNYMPGPNGAERFNFHPTDAEKDQVLHKFNDLQIPENFEKVSPAYDPSEGRRYGHQPEAQINMQTTKFCEKLGIDDPLSLVLLLSGKELNYSTNTSGFNSTVQSMNESDSGSNYNMSQNSSFKSCAPLAASLPKPKWFTDDKANPDEIDLGDDDDEEEPSSEDHYKAFTTKYSTPFKSVLGMTPTPRAKLTLPSPKFDSIDATSITSPVLDASVNETNADATPNQSKKFKRRNQEIYADND